MNTELYQNGGVFLHTIYTIGYSCFEVSNFIDVLKRYSINSLIDVRSNPNSVYYTDYNSKLLAPLLKENGIIYRNYKEEFGARQDNKSFYSDGYLDFNKFVKSDQFISGMKKIEAGVEKNYIFAFMCAEKDPSTCHRNIMVAREFYKKGYRIGNILFDGSIELQESIENRLVNAYFPDRNQLTIFDEELSWEEMVNIAYQKRNEEIGYRLDEEGGEYY